jgi:hypothetical protein
MGKISKKLQALLPVDETPSPKKPLSAYLIFAQQRRNSLKDRPITDQMKIIG